MRSLFPLSDEVYTAIQRRYGSQALDVVWQDVPIAPRWRDPVWRVACRSRPVEVFVERMMPDDLSAHFVVLERERGTSLFLGICPTCNKGYWGDAGLRR